MVPAERSCALVSQAVSDANLHPLDADRREKGGGSARPWRGAPGLISAPKTRKNATIMLFLLIVNQKQSTFRTPWTPAMARSIGCMLLAVLSPACAFAFGHLAVARRHASPRLCTASLLLGMSDKEFERIAKVMPSIVDCAESAQAQAGWPVLGALQTHLGLSDAELKTALLRLPQLMLYEDYEGEIAPSLTAVQGWLALTDVDLKSLVLKLPQMLGLDYELEIVPRLDALQASLDCSDEALSAEVLCKPSSTGIEVRGSLRRAGAASMCAPTDEDPAGQDESLIEPTAEPEASKEAAAGVEDNEAGGMPPFLLEGLLLAAAAYFTLFPQGGSPGQGS